MPSKYGFGNTRKKSPYTMGKAHYGKDQKNPITMKAPGTDPEAAHKQRQIDTANPDLQEPTPRVRTETPLESNGHGMTHAMRLAGKRKNMFYHQA